MLRMRGFYLLSITVLLFYWSLVPGVVLCRSSRSVKNLRCTLTETTQLGVHLKRSVKSMIIRQQTLLQYTHN